MSQPYQWVAIKHPRLEKHQLTFWLVQPESASLFVSGNKQLKLKYHISEVQQQHKEGILTFGGAFSNHLVATAVTCSQIGIPCTGLVRTDQLDVSNPTMSACRQAGMQLIALHRQQYKQRQDPSWLCQLQQEYPDRLIVPEGGTSPYGVNGVAELNLAVTPTGKTDVLITATGSGGTLAGLAIGHPDCQTLGIAVVKDTSLPGKIAALSQQQSNWHLIDNFVGKGYGRFDDSLLQFCLDFKQQTTISLEPIYTGKAMQAIFKLIAEDYFKPGTNLVFLHTGGLQGLAGLLYRGLISQQHYDLLMN
ncbi:MAG: pyridoxal-phosphate dependent enzyme [Alkalimonas sp.]|nr:pyridoxal-phosphate dependent enzyme [Alkalimonas sp.]